MAKRNTGDDKLIQMGFRVPGSLKSEIDAAADGSKLSSNSWLLLAAEEKLERDRTGRYDISDGDLDTRIEAILARMLREREEKEND